MDRDKSRLRAIKRQLKCSGNKKLRKEAKQALENDEEIPEQRYGGRNYQTLNGMDHDATRRKE